MSTLNVANITDGTDTVATEYVVNGSAKAWVNFTGTGTPATRDSFNFSSITDNATGQYNVAVSSAMANANWSSCCLTNAFNGTGNADGYGFAHINNRTTTGGYLITVTSADSYADAAVNDWQIFGDLA